MYGYFTDGKEVPTTLKRKAVGLMNGGDWDGSNEADATTSIDDEYRWAGVEDPKIVITTSRDPSPKLKQFAKVRYFPYCESVLVCFIYLFEFFI